MINIYTSGINKKKIDLFTEPCFSMKSLTLDEKRGQPMDGKLKFISCWFNSHALICFKILISTIKQLGDIFGKETTYVITLPLIVNNTSQHGSVPYHLKEGFLSGFRFVQIYMIKCSLNQNERKT